MPKSTRPHPDKKRSTSKFQIRTSGLVQKWTPSSFFFVHPHQPNDLP